MADLGDPKAKPVSGWLAGSMIGVACALVGTTLLFHELDCFAPRSSPLCHLLGIVPASPPKQEIIPIPEVVKQPSSTSITLGKPETVCLRNSDGEEVCYFDGPGELRTDYISPLLGSARFKYDRVTEMWRGAPESIRLTLLLDSHDAPELPEALSSESAPGLLNVTPQVSASLIGSAGISVEALSEERKRVFDPAPVSWQWIATPEIEGESKLLTLTIFFHITDEGLAYTVKVLEDQINVRISPWQSARDSFLTIRPLWIYTAAGIFASCGIYLWARSRLGRGQ